MPSFAEIAEPITPEAPCGPDPELDPEVLNFLSVAEGQLPSTYRDFDRRTFNSKPVLENLVKLLAKSRDIRFLVLIAKYNVLSDNVHAFAESIDAAANLLTAQWDACHPTENAGGAALRAAYLKTWDDLPTSVLPLQNATLFQDKRIGAVTWRSILVAENKAPVRVGEKAPDIDTLRDALLRYEPAEDINRLRDNIASISTSLSKIRQQFIDKAGHSIAPQFDELPQLANAIVLFLDAASGKQVEAQAPRTDGTIESGGPISTDEGAEVAAEARTGISSVTSVKEASNALASVLAYYASAEPSSPARLLVKQAHQLVGKSFVDAMKILAPKLAEQSKIQIGGEAPFTLDFARLSALAGEEAAAPINDSQAREYAVNSRAAASELMRNIEQFYRSTEPSSPIPLLVERARNFVARDFASLMKEMMVKTNEKG